jgi:hypothetical protein
MRVINNQTKEDMKYTPAFDPDKLPVCQNCGDDMLRDKTTENTVYLECKGKDCKRRYRAERILLVKRPIIKIYPATTGDFNWIVDIMRPATEAVREAIKGALADSECTLGMRGALSRMLQKNDEELALDLLLDYEDTEYINNPVMNQEQNQIRDIINKALDKALNPESIKKIMRFVFYAVSLRDNSFYNNVLQAWEKWGDAISMDLKRVSTKGRKHKHKGNKIPDK